MDIMAGDITAGAVITTVGVEVVVITTVGDTIVVGKRSLLAVKERVRRIAPDLKSRGKQRLNPRQ